MTNETTDFTRPGWASFHEDEYTDPPEDWIHLDATSESCEYNDDPEEMAPVIAAHRFEIVALKSQIKEIEDYLEDMGREHNLSV